MKREFDVAAFRFKSLVPHFGDIAIAEGIKARSFDFALEEGIAIELWRAGKHFS